MDINDIPEKRLLDYAGNGMHLPCVGFSLLVAVLALQPVSNSKMILAGSVSSWEKKTLLAVRMFICK